MNQKGQEEIGNKNEEIKNTGALFETDKGSEVLGALKVKKFLKDAGFSEGRIHKVAEILLVISSDYKYFN